MYEMDSCHQNLVCIKQKNTNCVVNHQSIINYFCLVKHTKLKLQQSVLYECKVDQILAEMFQLLIFALLVNCRLNIH